MSYSERLHKIRPDLVHKVLREFGYLRCKYCEELLSK